MSENVDVDLLLKRLGELEKENKKLLQALRKFEDLGKDWDDTQGFMFGDM